MIDSEREQRKRTAFLRNERKRMGADFLRRVGDAINLDIANASFVDEDKSLRLQDCLRKEGPQSLRSGVLNRTELLSLLSYIQKSIEQQEVYVGFDDLRFGFIIHKLHAILNATLAMIQEDSVVIEDIYVFDIQIESALNIEVINIQDEKYKSSLGDPRYLWELFVSGGWALSLKEEFQRGRMH